MKEQNLKIACNSIAGISDVSEISFEEVLEELTGSIFSEEEASEIMEYMEAL